MGKEYGKTAPPEGGKTGRKLELMWEGDAGTQDFLDAGGESAISKDSDGKLKTRGGPLKPKETALTKSTSEN